jgi:phage shock protein A
MSHVSVADLIEYDALPDEVRALCEKKIAFELEEASERRYEEGVADGKEEAGDELNPEVGRLERELEKAEERIAELEAKVQGSQASPSTPRAAEG